MIGGAVADVPQSAMQEYRCRECGSWLLTSSATWGKAELVCRRERCKARNTIYFGGYQRRSVESLTERNGSA